MTTKTIGKCSMCDEEIREIHENEFVGEINRYKLRDRDNLCKSCYDTTMKAVARFEGSLGRINQ